MLLGTSASRKVCEEVSAATGGEILLAFSRGKDSVASWLWLREFFPRIIPFHLAAVPGLGFVERSLSYYEKWFGTPIVRCVAGELYRALGELVYQPVEDEEWIDGLGFLPPHTTEQVARRVRQAHSCPRAWTAYGISATDSIVRRSAAKYRTGKSAKRKVLYPCFDWPRSLIMQTIEKPALDWRRITCLRTGPLPAYRP